MTADRLAADKIGAEEVIDLLSLEPLSAEGGMFSVAWREEASSAIYFLLRPDDFSALHRLDATEIWHHYAGAPVGMLLLSPDGTVERPVLGDDLRAGQRPLIPVPGGVWMAAATDGDWSLVGTTMAPPYDEDRFELGWRDELIERYPEAANEISALTRASGTGA